jgi:hypothetical protein
MGVQLAGTTGTEDVVDGNGGVVAGGTSTTGGVLAEVVVVVVEAVVGVVVGVDGLPHARPKAARPGRLPREIGLCATTMASTDFAMVMNTTFDPDGHLLTW